MGRKLGVKVQNPAAYIDEYTEKWYSYGFEENSLLDIALYCLKTERGDFECMHETVYSLFKNGVVSADGVKAYLKDKNNELKLFTKIQAVCGGLRKSAANLELVSTWQSWGFEESMILEAAKRSASGSNPIPYMNKILSDWKQKSVFALDAIPAPPASTAQSGNSTPRTFVHPSVDAANAKAERERYYALLREKAQSVADKFLAKANENARFKEIAKELSKMEIALAKAEVFEPAKLPTLKAEKKALLTERKQILANLGIEEKQLVPQFSCSRCLDTGFLPDGTACNCYKSEK